MCINVNCVMPSTSAFMSSLTKGRLKMYKLKHLDLCQMKNVAMCLVPPNFHLPEKRALSTDGVTTGHEFFVQYHAMKSRKWRPFQKEATVLDHL